MKTRYKDGDFLFLAGALADLASAMRSNNTPAGVVYDLQISFGWDRPNRDMPIVKASMGDGGSVVVADLGDDLEILL